MCLTCLKDAVVYIKLIPAAQERLQQFLSDWLRMTAFVFSLHLTGLALTCVYKIYFGYKY